VFTEYAIPTAGSGSQAIALGPDGNIWFVENSTGKLGKVTTAGVFTEYQIPTPSSSPAGITVGPDGNIWLTENFANDIAKVA
jgi:virginiamycin B lyase